MKLRHLSLATLVLMFLVTLLLVGASRRKHDFYRTLREKTEQLISQTVSVAPWTKITKDKLTPQFPKSLPSKLIKIVIESVSSPGHQDEIRYYHQQALIAIDRLDEGEKLVRRDLLDATGRTRVQIFYDANMKAYKVDYLDESQRRIYSEPIYIPFIPPGGGYR